MSEKEDKKGKFLTEKKSMPNLDRTDRSKGTDLPAKRKSIRFHKYQNPCFGAVSRGLETDPPGFPPLDLLPFDDKTWSKGKGDASGGSADQGENLSSPRTEFKMIREDFPALPGTCEESREFCRRSAGDEPPSRRREGKGKCGIETRPDGRMTDVPGSMLKDQFGMAGLLSFLRAAERDRDLQIHGFGEDLTEYGFNLDSKNYLHPDFYGPFAERPARPQDVDYDVPKEYLHHRKTKKKLPAIDFSRYDDDTLFYLFYTFVGDRKQLLAAAHLYDKDWRFHTEENYWMSLVADEKNCYFFFDPAKWCRVRVADYEIDIEKLAGRPRIPDACPPNRPAVRRPFAPANRQIRQDRNATFSRATTPNARPRLRKPLRPAFSQCSPVEPDHFNSCLGAATFFPPCGPVQTRTVPKTVLSVVPSRAVPIPEPYAAYEAPDVYARQRNIRTLYAPPSAFFHDPENDDERTGRKKKH